MNSYDFLSLLSLEHILKLFYSCTSYNYNMSYFEIETEINPNQYLVINYPESWQQILQDKFLIENLFLFSIKLHQNKSDEHSILIIRIIMRFVQTRINIFENKKRKNEFVEQFGIGINMLMQYFSQQQSSEIGLEVIEINIRFIVFYLIVA